MNPHVLSDTGTTIRRGYQFRHRHHMARRVGLEPTSPFRLPVFKTGAFSLSATFPYGWGRRIRTDKNPGQSRMWLPISPVPIIWRRAQDSNQTPDGAQRLAGVPHTLWVYSPNRKAPTGNTCRRWITQRSGLRLILEAPNHRAQQKQACQKKLSNVKSSVSKGSVFASRWP